MRDDFLAVTVNADSFELISLYFFGLENSYQGSRTDAGLEIWEAVN